VERACAIQNNACADAINSGQVTDAGVSDCSDQETVCVNFGAAKWVREWYWRGVKLTRDVDCRCRR
jgi:hypothetical protein